MANDYYQSLLKHGELSVSRVCCLETKPVSASDIVSDIVSDIASDIL